jgi:hypothetical protein
VSREEQPVRAAHWLDTNEQVTYTQRDGKVTVEVPTNRYSENMVIRVAKISV